MGNSWNTFDAGAHDPRTPMRVHLFCSRNKDNVGVAGFTQRRRAFIALDSDAMSVRPRDGLGGGGGGGRTVTLKRDDMLIRAWDTNAFGND